ncbi:haloacid dehalogenase superfamily, subfamily IA, variant 3 with third motif having DD or ED/haloacid dehalogenase superfamily, subfamily IA, variant 1 with third motif having Dx(3-4)D or Dx(3-4)E [Amycolatopsis tolypomycina]|uniref:Haloacid dehalogenase superfamily, subfamily IA, variant 3 with third motif having DD or ED/haloacid dehalogenase superfamily, subfamily IA, variant 1 with third motif having Dx(3-4)D or Dx(3-4)E n=1 Tax=Amycolatopsis tolypomycina TaxID=208445 RepID=A0A1H4TC30_9PSEU|nr:HAD family hydrolase [Amycolatopsis tolypomycina]SEC53691.1 haloacid dehalogenase superfamily, subfamily IA, variant 3 with third motif having DD or ED/haloacid dehalogenase superfamily, subfamily IA, variant 1 with third motif having Dx(3-4)D or Dx(3-4)E [Amycolatopsis tolypomycina]
MLPGRSCVPAAGPGYPDRPPAHRREEPAIATAVLFDVDGTLVDSNYLHVHAWHRAFHALDRPVDSWRVHRAIGKGSGKLLRTLLGDEDADRIGDRAKDLHSRFYLETADLLRPFDRAPDLVRELAGRGVRVVLATSAGPDELDALRKVLDVDDVVTGIVSGDDVEATKPDPEPVFAALEKAGTEPAETIFVGDAVWDVHAATKAGVRTVSVRSGGVSAAELTEAGAVAVYDDAATLLAGLDESVLIS